MVAMVFTACKPHDLARAPYLPLGQVEATYGPLITAGNHPTPDQNGTGERVGLFLDASGDVWGLPLIVANSGVVLACAPPMVHEGKVTDTYPAGSVIIGSTNQPTGWRGGTGELEILLRDARGSVHWQAVRGAQLAAGAVCWTPESPGPQQQLHYYRLAPSISGAR
jgi:hypothetical protein